MADEPNNNISDNDNSFFKFANEDTKSGPEDSTASASFVLDELIGEAVKRIDDGEAGTTASFTEVEKTLTSKSELESDFDKRFRELFSGHDDLNNSNEDNPEKGSFLFELEGQDPFISLGDPAEIQFGFSKNVGVQTEATQAPSEVGGSCKMQNPEDIDAEDALLLIQVLVEDNKNLRKQVTKLEKMLRFIMSKYRKSVALLLADLEQSREIFPKMSAALKENNQKSVEKLDLIELEMKEVMRAAIKLDDRAYAEHEGMLDQLRVENEGLREMLKIASDFELPPGIHTANKSIQTGEKSSDTEPKSREREHISEEDDESDNDSLSFASEDSFHTAGAKSPFGSYSSVFFEAEDGSFEEGGEISVSPMMRCNQNLIEQRGLDGSGDSKVQTEARFPLPAE